MTEKFHLEGSEYITLNNLLKVEGWVESGAVAKQVIDEGMVSVDGVIETRKRCKLTVGREVSFNDNTIVIVE
ncbi:RNA-binding S4 domain-containing protein [Gilvimarinus sp. SDUM040013]|uniref:RNA-binding S4 domain-containing protein n=1 Tax=Gilvimarinus gilvus TaxID=3058038 RepID=A0ABU4S1M8_9GAMM|nr:RNA-binding S4 domain-containing protein [Gilvimarinus sp. SDUM040013]MDO3384691.1 RNA-binding S4 domain-containing protein [Gilvimarinus sp. SDUM040013]MDX6850834.1 RNA-binding S4 domain-containing protein [Gilvimarinus sp. SDUM040013]